MENQVAMTQLWKQQIPTILDDEGNLWYDCDVFSIPTGTDSEELSQKLKSTFSQRDELRITGNLCLDDNFILHTVFLGESGFFGNNTHLVSLTSGGCNEFGDYADTYDVVAGTYNLFGDFTDAYNVVAGAHNFFGDYVNTIDVKSGTYNSFGDYANTCDVTAGTYNFFGNYASTGDVKAGTFNFFSNYANTTTSMVTSFEDTFFGKSASIHSIQVTGGLYFSGPPDVCFGIVTALDGIHVDFPNSTT